MFKSTIMACLSLVLVFGMASCGKGGKFSAKTKSMMGKVWSLDNDATRAAAGKALEDAGLKNGSDVTNLKGDVKKIANFISGHTLQFYKSKGKLAWQLKRGKGLLSSTKKGWANWTSKDETALELVDYNGKGKNATFKIAEVSDAKLVLVNEAGVKKVYKKK